MPEDVPKHRDKIEALDNMSLGISIAVAIAIGVGLGLLLKSWTGYTWTLWVGIAYGIAAAILNVYKAYSKQYKAYEDLAKEPRYAIKKKLQDDEDDENYGEKSY